ncbi:TIGR02996 domain-containing protein [Thalassoroseus pseudoceratinae]|uniref:TIGR02996 domain-containing protein n=1 Tax=Thalassoroseus pseudoceratinae TaxID=2713176 RepID=UPI00141EE067|nr:TIGR02996 domain-containing protein [Thalassoroseus pseudoceratinae]
MHTDNEFFQAVLADPDDLIPRLVYADWLDEQGDPRGEFIRVQCELADMPETNARRRALLTRQSELLHQHKQKWHAEVHRYFDRSVFHERVSKRKKGWIRNWRFGRGLVEHVSIGSEALEHPNELFGVGPLQSLQVHNIPFPTKARMLFRTPQLKQIRHLRIWIGGFLSRDAFVRQIIEMPFVDGLHSLEINGVPYQHLNNGRIWRRFPELENLLPIDTPSQSR